MSAQIKPRGDFVRLNTDSADQGDYPIDLMVTVGFNGDEVYGTVFFTGWPVYIVSYYENRNPKSSMNEDITHSMIEPMSIDKSEWEQIFANFLAHIGEANETFIDHVMEDGLWKAFEDSEGIGDGHELTAFVGDCVEKMRELQPDVIPEKALEGWR